MHSTSISLFNEHMLIDWAHCARPQRDYYDSRVLMYLDSLRGWVKHVPPPRSVTLAHGTIEAVLPKNVHRVLGNDSPFVLEQEWSDQLTPFLNQWTAGYESLSRYMDEFLTWRTGNPGKGCSSGHLMMSDDHLRHTVYVTSDDLQGCAQGIYHEFGHLRLETFGIYIEHHDGLLLLNPPDELYNSSVRKDCKRPMSAVLHGVYAWLMFTENDYHIYLGNDNKDDFAQYTARNIPKIEEGIAEIRAYARWTSCGTDFIDGLFEWADDLTSRCNEIGDTA